MAIAKGKTIPLIPSKSVPKAKQDAFEHICGQRQTVVKQLSDRQRLPLCYRATSRVIHIQSTRACTMCIALLHEYMLAHTQHQFLVFVTKQRLLSLVHADMSVRMGCSVGVHTRFSACGCIHTSLLRCATTLGTD
mmetsp:Transcript_26497/g.38983  ORF Transcript_26497/g.38983 Transcript_26497/m.38983 type:complete len:135 (-) Transcript_26497:411-815(-)